MPRRLRRLIRPIPASQAPLRRHVQPARCPERLAAPDGRYRFSNIKAFGTAESSSEIRRGLTLKKVEKPVILPFDRANRGTYIPRPRRPMALVLRAVFRLWQNGISPLAGLFDIVIRGRGTWAAARSQLGRKFEHIKSSIPNARVLQQR